MMANAWMRSLPCLGLCMSVGCGSDASPGATKNDSAKIAEEPEGRTSDAEDSYRDYPDPRGECDITSGYPDDHACILPPATSEGMQIHIGPARYDDPDEVAKFVLHPGEETSQCWTFHTPNESEVYYQTSVLSGRAGTHHIINTMLDQQLDDGGFGRCADGEATGQAMGAIGPLPGASKPYMARNHVAPENAHVGRTIPPHVAAQADMHYYNFTDHDIIREFWLNIYYADPAQITGEAQQIRAMGGFSWNQDPIQPGTDEVYHYECPIVGDGRILNLLGHYHAHGKRFSASLKRGDAEPQKVFEMYDYLDPASFEYDSRTQNPGFSEAAAGAISGILEVHDGDVLGWDCHVVNDSQVALRYVNEVQTGEMCNLWGLSYGIDTFNCLKP
jgi:hypothetical protein